MRTYLIPEVPPVSVMWSIVGVGIVAATIYALVSRERRLAGPEHGELQIRERFLGFRDLVGSFRARSGRRFLHLLATVAQLAGPGGARSVVAESVLVKHQLLILNRSRKRSPNLRVSDRLVAGILKPSTLLSLHRALTQRKYRQLFSSTVLTKPGPKGPSQDVIAAVVDMKRRNPTWGCPRIAQQIVLAFAIPITKDVVRRILAVRYRPAPDSAGPSWLTVVGHRRTVCGVSTCFDANRRSCAPTACWS
jgi:hypothetical protein